MPTFVTVICVTAYDHVFCHSLAIALNSYEINGSSGFLNC